MNESCELKSAQANLRMNLVHTNALVSANRACFSGIPLCARRYTFNKRMDLQRTFLRITLHSREARERELS